MPRIVRRLARRLGPARLVLGSFATAVLLGTALLVHQAAAATGASPVGLVDALFTATSAVRITGPTTLGAPARRSPLGRAALLVLKQLGGLGIVTCSTLLVLPIRGRFTVRGRLTVQDTLGSTSAADLERLIATVFASTFAIEAAAGALPLGVRFAFEPRGRLRCSEEPVLVG